MTSASDELPDRLHFAPPIQRSRTRGNVKLSKAEVAFSGLIEGLTKIVHQWHPGELPTELRYRDSLQAFLRDAIPKDCNVEKEYRHHGTTIDLYIHWSGLLFNDRVFVEIKRNLNKKAELDRLIGQLETLRPGKATIMVVFVGRTDEALVGRLKEKYRQLLPTKYEFDTSWAKPLAIIVKS
jgi:hypothetical protein